MTTETLSPAQKAAATRRARRDQGFSDIAAAASLLADAAPSVHQMADVDLLATMLAGVCTDGRAVASALVKRFGSFAQVATAPRAKLEEISKPAATLLTAMHAGMVRVLRGDVRKQPVLSSWSAVLDYLRCAMAFGETEEFRILFLDKRNQLIADEVQGRGTVDHVPVYPREVVKRALEHNATAIVLAHNHPSGDPTPSRADIDMTRLLADALKPLGIIVHDHIIVGKDGDVSMKGLKLI